MIDYQRFLSQREELVLPWGGGPRIAAPGRSLVLRRRPAAAGWWRVRIEGREALPLEPAAAPDPEQLAGLPQVRGARWGQRLVPDDARPRELLFLGEDDPERFAPLAARRWHDGAWLLVEEDLEGPAEEPARRAFDERAGLTTSGVGAALRAAFACATLERAARELSLPWHPLETLHELSAVAAAGAPEAERLLARRAEARRARAPRSAPAPSWQEARDESRARRRPLRLVERALGAAGAQLLSARSLEGGRLLAVRYRFLEGRFESVVEVPSPRVVDAGICLEGADRRLTLESLPGVIREAVQRGALYVTRAGGAA